MDMALIRQLFINCIAASKELGVDADFRERIEKAQARLYPYKIGSRGQLQEWSKDYAEVEPTHRHISHLVGVWPMNHITPRGTPELFAAAKRSMDLRENGGGMPDKSGMLARLGEADRAAAMFSRNGPSSFLTPFGGFAELLVQSHTPDIELLPALPTAWTQGDVDGLRARGGFVVAMKWNNSRLESAKLTSQIGKPARVRTAVPVNVTQNGKPVTVARPEPHVVKFATEASKVYDLSPVPE
jgi:alpha-L-fucosidase 2